MHCICVLYRYAHDELTQGPVKVPSQNRSLQKAEARIPRDLTSTLTNLLPIPNCVPLKSHLLPFDVRTVQGISGRFISLLEGGQSLKPN